MLRCRQMMMGVIVMIIVIEMYEVVLQRSIVMTCCVSVQMSPTATVCTFIKMYPAQNRARHFRIWILFL
jgi:hypothetical protein